MGIAGPSVHTSVLVLLAERLHFVAVAFRLDCDADRIFQIHQVTRLCESPFISQAFREQEQSDRVRELEQGGRAARLKIDHLQVI